jgi:hypothetical protein
MIDMVLSIMFMANGWRLTCAAKTVVHSEKDDGDHIFRAGFA